MPPKGRYDKNTLFSLKRQPVRKDIANKQDATEKMRLNPRFIARIVVRSGVYEQGRIPIPRAQVEKFMTLPLWSYDDLPGAPRQPTDNDLFVAKLAGN